MFEYYSPVAPIDYEVYISIHKNIFCTVWGSIYFIHERTHIYVVKNKHGGIKEFEINETLTASSKYS